MHFKRFIRSNLVEALSTSPAVLITGARQTGKTTLVEEYARDKNYHYITFDDLDIISAAKRDLKGFVGGLPKPIIIDEVQRVPDIFFPIKRDIDLNRQPGRYILTGSTNPLYNAHIRESLAGRLETLELYPLSQGELIEQKEDFISKAFSDTILLAPKTSLSKEDLYKIIVKGGYPSVETLSEKRRNAWFNSYINNILQKDIRDLARIEAIEQLPNLFTLLAIRAAGLLNVAELSRTNGMSATTLHRYITLLQALYLIGYSQPWSSRLGMRLLKSPKLYLIDTGILSYLQEITVERLLKEPQFTGNLLENFVWSELTKQVSWSDMRVKIYHFRTAGGIEIDILLEDQMGRVVGVEVKNSETVQSHDFKGLNYLSNVLGSKFMRGIVLYTGKTAVPFGKNLFAMPIASLWAP